MSSLSQHSNRNENKKPELKKKANLISTITLGDQINFEKSFYKMNNARIDKSRDTLI